MANKGYTTNAAVAAFLGRTLSSGQQSQADTLIGFAEAYIDRATNRAWLVPAITDERYDLLEPVIYLRYAPVETLSQIRTRTTAVGDTPLTLTAGVDYELIDATLGEVRFVSGYRGQDAYALVSYTPDRPVPADIAQAATMIVAETLYPAIFPDRQGIQRAEPERGVVLIYAQDGTALTVPEIAQRTITGYRKPIFS